MRHVVAIIFGLCALMLYTVIHYKWPAVSTTHKEKEGQHRSHKLWPPNPYEEQPLSRSSVLHLYERAAICSDGEICSVIGRQIIEHGGSAVDAAISTLLCNGLIAMQSMGLGGGMLMNVYLRRERRSYSILAREISPQLLSQQMLSAFDNSTQLQQSKHSIAVPGELMGYAVAHEKFGKLAWRDLVLPTAKLCRTGYALTKHQRDALNMNKLMVMRDPNLRLMFVDPLTKEFRAHGSHIKPVDVLCRTYEQLAEKGPRSFYTGTLGKTVLSDLFEIGSAINAYDFKSIKAKIVPSVMLPLNDYMLHLTPAPASGHVLGFVMNILQKFKQQFERNESLRPLDIHRIVEALKFGFAKRWQLDTKEDKALLDALTCPEYARKLAETINDTCTSQDPQFYGANIDLKSRLEYGTAHISVVSPDGDAVSVTSSLNYYFGSGRTGSRSGVLFNNAMSDFSHPHLDNYFDLPYIPNKNQVRMLSSPMSSMAPLIVTNRADGDVRLVVGAAGGTKIISALTQLLVRTLWQKQDIKTAIDAPRFHHQLLPNVLEYEYGILHGQVESLEMKCHHTKRYRNRGSAICAVERRNNSLYAMADHRKDGGVAGF